MWRRRTPPQATSKAFTLIELLVVIVILGVLMAVALPTYLRQQQKSKDSNAKGQLTYAYRAIRSALPEFNDAYPSVSSVVSAIAQSEPELTVASGGCNSVSGDKQIAVDPVLSSAAKIALYTKSSSGTWWRLFAATTGAQVFTPLGTCQGALSTATVTASGNEVSDAVRDADIQGDGRGSDSSFGIWQATTNLAPAATDAALTGYDSGANIWAASPAPDFATSGFYRITSTNPNTGLATSEIYEHDQKRFNATAGTTYTWSLIYRTDGNGYLRLHVWPTDQTPNNASFNMSVQDLGNGTDRASYTYTMVNSGPARSLDYNPVWGSSTYFDIKWVQVEQKSIATPYAPQGGSRAAARVQAPASLLNATQGWVAMRVRMGYSSTALPGTYSGYFAWGDGTTGSNSIMFHRTGTQWRMERSSGGSTSSAYSVSQTWNRGDFYTLIGAWTATQVKVSVNGGPFVAVSNSYIPAIVAATFDIGSAQNENNALGWSDSDMLWFAAGKGTLSDGDAQTIGSWGSNDPTSQDFPAAAQASMAWAADTSTYLTGN